MKKIFSAIGRFLKTNYWLQPLLLVAIVFVLVFSIQGFQGVIDTVKGWFSPNSSCSECDSVRVSKTQELLSEISEDEVIYVYYYEKKDDNSHDANGALNLFIENHNKDLKAAGKEKVTVYSVNYGVKEYYEINADEPKKFYDKSMDLETYKEVSEYVRLYLAEHEPTQVENKAPYEYLITAPTLVSYTKTADGYEVSGVMYATTGESVKTIFNQANLKSFFEGNYSR